jgi:hypothetical protein
MKYMTSFKGSLTAKIAGAILAITLIVLLAVQNTRQTFAAKGMDSQATQIAFCAGQRLTSIDLSIFQSHSDPRKGFLSISVHGDGPLSHRIVPATLNTNGKGILEVIPQTKTLQPFKVPFGTGTQAQYVYDQGEYGTESIVCFTKPE